MQRTATPCTPVRFRLQPPIVADNSPGGEIGRRKGLKIPRWQHRAGSTPAPGTAKPQAPLLQSRPRKEFTVLYAVKRKLHSSAARLSS